MIPDTLRKLELTGSDGSVTLAALLCFGKNPQSPFGQAVMKAGRLRGDVKILDDRLIDGPLLLQVDEAVNFLKKHMQVEYVIGEGLERNDVWGYPLPALRETLMNAVCHRDYGDLAEIQIKVFDGSLQIWSPGFLPFGVTVEDLFLPTHASKPRNRFIAQIFYDMGFIEKYGSGTGRILEECRKAGLSDPEFGNFSGGFRVLFQSDKHVPPQVPRKYPASTPQVQRLLRGSGSARDIWCF